MTSINKLEKHRGTIWWHDRTVFNHPDVITQFLMGSIPIRTEFHFDRRIFEHTCLSMKLFPETDEGSFSPQYTIMCSTKIVENTLGAGVEIEHAGWELVHQDDFLRHTITTYYRSEYRDIHSDSDFTKPVKCQAQRTKDTDSGGSHSWRCQNTATVMGDGLFLCFECAAINHKKIDGFYPLEVPK